MKINQRVLNILPETKADGGCCYEAEYSYVYGYNQAIDDCISALEGLEIGFDVEELARQCYLNCAFDNRPWSLLSNKDKEMFFIMAKDFISAMPKILKITASSKEGK